MRLPTSVINSLLDNAKREFFIFNAESLTQKGIFNAEAQRGRGAERETESSLCPENPVNPCPLSLQSVKICGICDLPFLGFASLLLCAFALNFLLYVDRFQE
jgi:hypothetical protein